MNTLDDVCTITCAKCGQAAPFYQWRETTISGPLPDGEYQCPHCGVAFERRHVRKPYYPHSVVKLQPIGSRL
jgi:DNA-directed RNA polymerase subunit RPC12/RpoP